MPGALDLTRDEKIQLIVGATVVVGIGVLTFVGFNRFAQAGQAPTKNYGIKINATCSDWEITNQSRLDATFEATLDQEIANGNLDAHSIANKFLGKISGNRCKGFGTDAKTPREAMLYYIIFRDVLEELKAQDLIKDSTFSARLLEAQAWGIEQGVNPNDFDSLEELIREG